MPVFTLERFSNWKVALNSYEHEFGGIVLTVLVTEQSFDLTISREQPFSQLLHVSKDYAQRTGLRIVNTNDQLLATFDEEGALGKFQIKFASVNDCSTCCSLLASHLAISSVDVANKSTCNLLSDLPKSSPTPTPASTPISTPAPVSTRSKRRRSGSSSSSKLASLISKPVAEATTLEMFILDCLQDPEFPALIDLVEQSILHFNT